MASESSDPTVPGESAHDLYEHAPCGYLSATPEGLIVRINETLLGWLGVARADVVHKKRLSDLLTVGGRVFLETHVRPLLSMQGSVHEIAVDLARPGGALPVLLNAVLDRSPAGDPVLVRASLFNVTDRRRYERELLAARRQAEAAAQAKSDFVSMISHEIRTPLSAIIGIAQLLKKTELTPHQEKLVSVLRSSADNLLGLLNDILDFSKIEAGKITLEEQPVDLRSVVENVIETLRIKTDEKGIALVTSIDPELPSSLLADPIKVRQVLTNLVSNAVKFTSRGAVDVLVTVEESGPTCAVRFEVRDTGIGIAPDRLAHIFEDFTQASYEISVKYGGTGLGLAITRKLVELHGSKIFVESTPGVGSRFWFTLRLRRAERGSERPAEAEEDVEAIRGIRVLLADDNDVNRFVIGGFLEKWGVQYDVVENGRQALEMITSHDYDVVLMDLRMPELAGPDAVRAVRRIPEERYRKLPIIAVSASIRMGDQESLESIGFTDFVGKPVSAEILLKKLVQHAAKR